MKTERMKNTFLGIIAINLTLITLIQLDIFPPKAYASESVPTVTPLNTNYGLVPLNENGSIDVNLVETSAVYIKGWYDDYYKEYVGLSMAISEEGIPVKIVRD